MAPEFIIWLRKLSIHSHKHRWNNVGSFLLISACFYDNYLLIHFFPTSHLVPSFPSTYYSIKSCFPKNTIIFPSQTVHSSLVPQPHSFSHAHLAPGHHMCSSLWWMLCTRSPPGSFYPRFNIQFKCLIPDTWAELRWCCRSCSWPAKLLLLGSQFHQHLPVYFPHDIITLKQKPNLEYSWDLSTLPGTMPGTERSSIMAAWCLNQSASTFIPSTASILSVTEHKEMRFQCEMKWCWFLKGCVGFHQREGRDSIQFSLRRWVILEKKQKY